MRIKKTLLIGQLPPPRHGMSSAFEILVSGFGDQNIPHKVINASPGKHKRKVGSFSFIRLLQSIVYLFRAIFWTPFHDNIYLIVAITRIGFFKDLPILLWASLLRKHLVVQMHSGNFANFYRNETKWIQWLIHYSYSRISDLVIEDSSFTEQFITFTDRGMKIHAVLNCLPSNVPELCDYQKRYDGQIPKLLYLSNLFESKGYLDVLSAIKILVYEYGKNVEAHFCGGFHPQIKDGKVISNEEQEQLFCSRIKEYGLDSHVIYHSFVDNKEKTDLLIDSHIMILPTYYELEGQPISLIEGLAYQLPLIATEYRGIKSEIIPGYNGLFVPPRSPHSIADAVEKIISSVETYTHYSQHSRELFNKHFHKDVRLSRLIPIIIGD